jgi:hypothetical protein
MLGELRELAETATPQADVLRSWPDPPG